MATSPHAVSPADNAGPSMSPTITFSYPPNPQDWAKIKEVVRALYVVDKKHLRDVRNILRDQYGFRATDRMIKARLKHWGYMKNAKKEDWYFLARLHHQRKQEGRTTVAFDVRDHRKTVKDLQRFIRNQQMNIDDFILEALENTQGKPIPSYIRALDSTDENATSNEDSASVSRTSSPRNLVLSSTSWSGQRNPQNNFPSAFRTDSHSRSDSGDILNASLSAEPKTMSYRLDHSGGWLVKSPSVLGLSGLNFCKCTHMQTEFEALVRQVIGSSESLLSRIGVNDLKMGTMFNGPDPNTGSFVSHDIICPNCGQSFHDHSLKLEDIGTRYSRPRNILNGIGQGQWHLPVSKRQQGPWPWASRCFLSCMCLSRGDEKGAEHCLNEASKEFEQLLLDKDPSLLTAAGLIITFLHQHDQGGIALRVMQSADAVANRLPQGDPIRTTINYLTLSADDPQKQRFKEAGCPVSSKVLEQAWHALCQPPYSSDHPYAIAARHNLSWMLKYEGNYKQAQEHAEAVYNLSWHHPNLGKHHMQTITALAIQAACLELQHQDAECIKMYGRVIWGSETGRPVNGEKAQGGSEYVLGKSHPYVLEAKRRLAWHHEQELHTQTEALELYKEVLEGRVMNLGRKHSYTIGARETYERMLHRLDRWSDLDCKPSAEQLAVERLFAVASPSERTAVKRETGQHVSDGNHDNDEITNDEDYDDNDDEDDE